LKTNATRILESLGIRYEQREYQVNPDDLAAETVAAKIGMPPEQVFKTLVVRGDRGGVYLAVIPGNSELDTKSLARITGDRRIELASLKEVQPLTGYIRGGVTALGGKKDYPVYIDETAQLFDVISSQSRLVCAARRLFWRRRIICGRCGGSTPRLPRTKVRLSAATVRGSSARRCG